MLIVSNETVESVIAAKEKLANPEKKAECIAEIENLIEAKQSHIARVDAFATCCANICTLASLFEVEIGFLQNALEAIEEGNNSKAISSLEDYLDFLKRSYGGETPIIDSFRLKRGGVKIVDSR
jgi:hypothetical protein